MHKKKPTLTKEEREIENAIKRGEYLSVSNTKQTLSKLQEAAKRVTEKNKAINIRLTTSDYIRLKAKAMEEGIPYQTYVASLVHKAVR